MSLTDTVTKVYVSNNKVFADLMNTFIFHGRQVIDPALLQTRDPNVVLQKKKLERDAAKEAMIKVNDNYTLAIWDVENQTCVDDAMPLRTLVYGVGGYERQMRDYMKERRGKLKGKTIKRGTLVQELTKGLKLKPIIALVILWVNRTWDGLLTMRELFPEDIYEMFKDFLPQSRIHVVSIYDVTEAQLQKMRNQDLKNLIRLLQCSTDTEKLKKFVQTEKMVELSEEAVDVFNALTQSNVDREGGKNMCIAIDEIKQEYADEVLKKERARAEKDKEREVKRVKAEAEKDKEREVILSVYQFTKTVNPEMKESEIIKKIAEMFHKSTSTIRRLIKEVKMRAQPA